MALPTSYDDTELAQYMHGEIGITAKTLNWTVEKGSYGEAINEVLFTLGRIDLADFLPDEINKLRAVSRREVWKAVVKACSGFYTFSADFQTFNLDQLYKHAMASLALANADCTALGVPSNSAPQVKTSSWPFSNDPYKVTLLPGEI